MAQSEQQHLEILNLSFPKYLGERGKNILLFIWGIKAYKASATVFHWIKFTPPTLRSVKLKRPN